MAYISKTPTPPYYAVVFTSINADVDHTEHNEMYARLVQRAATYEGYLGIEGARNSDGTGVAAVYFKDLANRCLGKRSGAPDREAQRPRNLVLALHDPHMQGGACLW